MKTFLLAFQCDPEEKKPCGNESQEKETKHIYASATDLSHIRIGNLNWCKCGHCKNGTSEIDCLSCREIEVDASLLIQLKFHRA